MRIFSIPLLRAVQGVLQGLLWLDVESISVGSSETLSPSKMNAAAEFCRV